MLLDHNHHKQQQQQQQQQQQEEGSTTTTTTRRINNNNNNNNNNKKDQQQQQQEGSTTTRRINNNNNNNLHQHSLQYHLSKLGSRDNPPRVDLLHLRQVTPGRVDGTEAACLKAPRGEDVGPIKPCLGKTYLDLPVWVPRVVHKKGVNLPFI